MKPIDALRGRRLLVRLYLYEAFLFGVIIVSAALVVRFVLEPSVQSERRAALTLVSEGLLADASQPARFQAALASIRDSAPMSITVFDPGGAILATTAPGLHRPLDAASLLRRNLLIYGVGGIIAPFPGIWLIDQLLVMLHLA